MKKKLAWKLVLLFVILLISWLVYAQFGKKYRMSDGDAKEKFEDAGVSLYTGTIDVDESELHYAKTGNDTLPILFFVHGSPGSWMKFEEYLRDKDLLNKFRMISVDRPGFGYSDFGNVKSLEEQSRIISALLVKVKNEKPIYAIGRSYGGPMIVKLAIDNPGTFSGLVLLASALDPDAEKPEKWRPLLFNSPLNFLIPGAWRPSNEELWYLKTELKELVRHYSQITCAVSILHGDDDGLVPVSNAEYAGKKFVNAKSISIKIIPGANHYISENNYDIVKEVLLKLY